MVESAVPSNRFSAPSNPVVGRHVLLDGAADRFEYAAPVVAPAAARVPSIRPLAAIENDAAEVTDSTAWNLGEMVVVRDTGPARDGGRDAGAARGEPLDHYAVLVSFSRDGATVDVDGERLKLGCGEPLLLDLARPFDVMLGTGTAVRAYLPRELLDELLDAPRHLHALRLAGASAMVLAEHLRSMTTCLPEMTAAQAPHAATATLHIIAASLASTPDSPRAAARAPIESSLLRQACRYIELHLNEPALCAADLCAVLKVSRATLYRLFEAYGGVASHIRERRLARIHEVLREGRGRRSLALIAEDHGFENAAHFSRAFRQRYGHCARDTAALAAHAGPAVDTKVGTADPLAHWLRALRG